MSTDEPKPFTGYAYDKRTAEAVERCAEALEAIAKDLAELRTQTTETVAGLGEALSSGGLMGIVGSLFR